MKFQNSGLFTHHTCKRSIKNWKRSQWLENK